LPASRMRWPSLTPDGMRTVMVRVWDVMPLPAQVGHGSSMTCPVPRQLRHGSENANAPWLRLVTPAPPQTPQVCGDVPGLAPLPAQVGHVPGLCIRSGTVTPSTASSKESVASVSTSCPRAGPDAAWLRPRAVPGPVPKRPPNRSPRPPVRPAPGPAPPAPPNRSPRSKGCPPPAPGKPPGKPPGRPPAPNRRRASSYSLRRFGSESTSYASDTSLKRLSACSLPGFLSGCRSRAIWR
jgi:hypothetical protein